MRRTLTTGIGGVIAAFLGSLCCVGPLLFVTLGVGAGLASTFEPLRPVFGGLMVALLGIGFWTVYGRRLTAASPARPGADAEGAPDPAGGAAAVCRAPARGRDVALLWTATVLALILWTFPTWSLWLL